MPMILAAGVATAGGFGYAKDSGGENALLDLLRSEHQAADWVRDGEKPRLR